MEQILYLTNSGEHFSIDVADIPAGVSIAQVMQIINAIKIKRPLPPDYEPLEKEMD